MPKPTYSQVSLRCTDLEFKRYETRSNELGLRVPEWVRAMVDSALLSADRFIAICHAFHNPDGAPIHKATKSHPERKLGGRIQAAIEPAKAQAVIEGARKARLRPTTAYRAILHAAIEENWRPIPIFELGDGGIVIEVPQELFTELCKVSSLNLRQGDLASILDHSLVFEMVRLNRPEHAAYGEFLRQLLMHMAGSYFGRVDEDGYAYGRSEMMTFAFYDRQGTAKHLARLVDLSNTPPRVVLSLLATLTLRGLVTTKVPKHLRQN